MRQLISRLAPFVGALVISVSCGCGGGGGGGDSDSSVDESPPPSSGESANTERVWTVEEVLAEPETGGAGGPALCGGEFGFKRCVCAPDVPSTVRYRPALEECGGNAAAFLGGNLEDAFSIVVRDSQNRDRWPPSGFNGCSAELADSESPPNSCSAFKVQFAFPIVGAGIRVHCFGASGYSDLFRDVVRVTIKLSDDPFSNDDEIERYCLAGPDVPLN